MSINHKSFEAIYNWMNHKSLKTFVSCTVMVSFLIIYGLAPVALLADFSQHLLK